MNSKPKILYADDEELFHMLIGITLDGSFEMNYANNGKEAFDMALHNDYDIILMDISMPIMTGDKSAEKIKKVKPNQYIIAMTAFCISEFNYAPFDDYYQKPINLRNLKDEFFKIILDGK